MQLSTKGRYAVMAMADLAKHGAGGTVPLSKVAARQSLSQPYLEQIFVRLRRAGLVLSARGPGGGYALARPADRVRIGEIMAAVDEPVHMIRCAGEESDGCVGRERCLTHDLWRALGDHIVAFLDAVSLGDVVDNASAREMLLAPHQTMAAGKAGARQAVVR